MRDMKKMITRIIAMMMCLVTITGMFSGCSSVSKTDIYLTKGEFMSLFVDETGIAPDGASDVKLDIKSENQYYYAALGLAEIGYLTAQEASTELDKAVTKEFVAMLCIEYLYFRENFDITFKDEDKLQDPQACKDAVGHGIVATKNGYFDANEKMTYQDCKSAIDRAMNIDATSEFEEGEAEINYELKDGVIDISAEAESMGFRYINPGSEEGVQILTQMGISPADMSATGASANSTGGGLYTLSNNGGISLLENEMCVAPVPVDQAKEGDTILVSCLASAPRVFDKGDVFVYSPWIMKDQSPMSDNQFDHYSLLSVGGIVEQATRRGLDMCYLVKVVSPEQIAELLKVDKAHEEANERWRLQETSGKEGISAKLDKNGDIIVEVHETIKMGKGETWRDPEYNIDVDYKFTIQDIKLDVSGFGDIFDGNIDNAICSLKYKVTNDLALTSQNRVTPDNNGNGKFPSNLRRSRLTCVDSKGAETIKIAKVFIPIYAGIEIQVDVKLLITADGQITIGLSSTYENGFKIVNNKLMPIKNVTPEEKSLGIFINAEAGVKVILTATFFRCQIANFGATAGIGVNFRASLSAIGEESESDSIENAYVSREALEALTNKASCDYEYEVGVQLYIFLRFEALTEDCMMGKILKKADIKLTLPGGEWVIYEKIYTNKEEQDKETKEQKKVSEDNNFVLTTYKLVLPEYCCSMTQIVEYPVKAEALDKMGGIRVYTKDPSVAVAYLVGDTISIESVGVGSTELIIETANKRFIQKCSITIVENSSAKDT